MGSPTVPVVAGQAALAARLDFARRALTLTVVFVLAAVLLISVSAPQVESTPAFPAEISAYAIDGWMVSPASVDGRAGVAFVSREYARVDGARARLSITTSPQAKLVYRAGADVPFLGNGYSVEPAPASLVPISSNRSAQIARRGTEAWLQIATFGERRGAFDNGPVAWSLAIFDMVLGRPNDYYLARILVPFDERNPSTSAAYAVELANTLFPRLAAFYTPRVT